MSEKPIRALLIAEAASPELVSVPLEGWSHSRAISALTPAHTITQIRNLGAWQRAGVDPSEYTALDSERVAKWAWRAGKVLSLGTNKGWTAKTAMRGVALGRALAREAGSSVSARPARRNRIGIASGLPVAARWSPSTPQSAQTTASRSALEAFSPIARTRRESPASTPSPTKPVMPRTAE